MTCILLGPSVSYRRGQQVITSVGNTPSGILFWEPSWIVYGLMLDCLSMPLAARPACMVVRSVPIVDQEEFSPEAFRVVFPLLP